MESRILIVDDEEMICVILAQRFFREKYVCTTVNDGREALRRFDKDTCSLIISDIKMPEMDGLELLKRVKRTNPNMMVMMMTAFPEIELAMEAMRLGAYDFILKPFDLEWVVLSVKRALEKKRLEEEVGAYHKDLERQVEERTAELGQTLLVLRNSHLESLKVLAGTIDAKDPYTRGHSDRVARMSLRIATYLGFIEEKLESVEFGALLHDIGKIGIRDEVLQKPGVLSPEEYQHIQEHPLIGVKILEGIEFFRDKIPIIRNHHEHFDGNGYPDGLIGETIPLEARIIAVSDVFDAMTSLRPHRGALSLEEALGELKKGRGKQFDPKIVDIFLREKIYKELRRPGSMEA